MGAFKIGLDWTSGHLFVQALTVQLLSLSYARPGVDGPWMFAFSIPAGAIAFLIVQRQKETAALVAPPPPAGPAPVA